MKAKNMVTMIPSSSSLLMIYDFHSEPKHIFLTTPIHTFHSFFFLNRWFCFLFIYVLAVLPSFSSVQFSHSVVSTLCDPMDCSTSGLPIDLQLLELAQTHVHWVRDAIQPSHPLSSPSPPTFNPSQHQGLFKWVTSLYQVAKLLEYQLQHQSFQWIFRTDFL